MLHETAKMYYRNGLNVPAVTVIPRGHFFKLWNYLHFADNLCVPAEVQNNNKLWKLQPIIDSVRKKCLSLSVSRHLSADEHSIIPSEVLHP
jgi:hypothetical protein